MGLISRIRKAFIVNRQDSIIFEAIQQCTNKCLHCYNVWYKEGLDYPVGTLSTPDTKKMLKKVMRESGCEQVTFTGGEPYLREDLFDLFTCVEEEGVIPSIISNGVLADEERIKESIKRGVTLFEFPLLSADAAMHDELSGKPGAFDKVLDATANGKLHGGSVVLVFVGTKKNIDGFEEMIELAIAIGADGIMFNRFNPGGRGADHLDELLPTVEQVKNALDVGEASSEKYGIGISCSIAIQPCLIDIKQYEYLSFGFCAAGTKRSYYTLDPMGNLRLCNHTPSIIGNIRKEPFDVITGPERIKFFTDARPKFCGGCKMEMECLGGCKAAAEVTYGSLWKREPFHGTHTCSCNSIRDYKETATELV